MMSRIAGFTVIVACIIAGTLACIHLRRDADEAGRLDFPVEGLVVQDDGDCVYETVPAQDRTMLRDLGFPQALGPEDAAHIRHLVLHLDCHYFFLTDGRVLVMSLGDDGRTPHLVETKVWHGPPHGFRDYRKDLLPTS